MSRPDSEPNQVSGGCQCGAIRFAFDRGSVVSSHHCHCRDCQKATGSAFATFFIVPGAAFELAGEPRRWEVKGASGRSVVRSFCGLCGSQLYSEVELMPGIFFVKSGALDDASWLEPASSFWASSAQPWSPPAAGIPAHERNPG